MREFLRPLVKIIIAFIVAGVFVNDIGAYFYTQYKSRDTADQIATSFKNAYVQTNSISSALYQAQNKANNLGVNIASYKVEAKKVTITIEVKTEKTLFIKKVKELEQFSKVKVTASSDINE